MKRILCFGDSNTWGYNPATAARYESGVRWTSLLQNMLGSTFAVIEEGQNGRTTVFDDPIENDRNGEKFLRPCLESQRPIDLVIIMLGTNDTKRRFNNTAYDIAAGMEKLLSIIENSGAGIDGAAPKILLMSPAPIEELTEFSELFLGAEEKSRQLAAYYKEHAKSHGCDFFDTASLIKTSKLDGIHLDAAEHKKLGKKATGIVQDIFK